VKSAHGHGEKHPSAHNTWAARFRSRHFWLGATLVVVIFLLSYYLEDIKDQFPWLIGAQLWSHGLLRPEPTPKYVVGVEIDNDTFFGAMHRNGPEDITDRKYLAQIVRNAADAGASVIALDINLVKQLTNGETSEGDNEALQQAIDYASNQKQIPVVLTFQFAGGEPLRPLQNAIATSVCVEPQNSAVSRAGFDNAPEDRRKIPLVVNAVTPDGKDELACRSFALQIAAAFESRTPTETSITKVLGPQIEDREFVYSTFIRQSRFTRFSAREIHDKSPAELNGLNGQIVLVGGNRTSWPTESSNPPASEHIDYYNSPKGKMAGMYFHANYVEDLLGRYYLRTVPRLPGALFDAALAMVIIVSIEHFAGWTRLVVVSILLAIPVVMAFVLASLGWCFDWVIPVFLSLLHPSLEKYLDIGSDPLRRYAHE
jgi:CHASE2 domain-containing sensor protein